MSEKELIQINKNTFFMGVIAVLFVALVASVVTGGFNLGNAPIPSSNAANPLPAPSVAPTQPTPQARIAPASIDQLLDDDATLGSDDAPIVLIEFSDFQCPFCRKFWRDSLPGIKADYIDTGKVQLVYRDFPLSFHPGSQKAAEAAECAREQGKWLEMHDLIFQEQDKQGQGTIQLSGDWSEDLKLWASKITGLDTTSFNSCLDSGKYRQEVLNDFQDGSASGISGTPGFIVGRRGETGQLISGAQPYQVFKGVFDQLAQ